MCCWPCCSCCGNEYKIKRHVRFDKSYMPFLRAEIFRKNHCCHVGAAYMRPAAFRETVGCGELAGGIYAVPTCRRCFLRVSTREAHGRDSPSRDAVAAAKCRGASRTPPPYTCRSEHCSPAEFSGCHKTLKLMATCRCTGKLKEALRIIDTLF